ncbi:hypothetical protein ACHAQA_006365 [Verticillium albo-atrum]
MLAVFVLPVLAGLTAASTPFHTPATPIPFNSTIASRSLFSLVRRQCDVACGVDETGGDACVEAGSTCCDQTIGSYCQDGYYCIDAGCCPDGETCDGPATSCIDPTETLCGAYCLPAGSECCDADAGLYCEPGNTCASDGCEATDGGGGGGEPTEPTPTPDTGSTDPTPTPDSGSTDPTPTPDSGAGGNTGNDSNDNSSNNNNGGGSNNNGANSNDNGSSDNGNSNNNGNNNGGFPNSAGMPSPQSALALFVWGAMVLFW